MGAILAEDRAIGLRAAAGALSGPAVGTPTADPPKQGELLDYDGPEGAQGPATQLLERRRGPGRPPGSPNKATADLRRFLLARFKHPVVALAEVYSIPTDALAAALGIEPRDALTLQIRAAAEVAPYVDSKMPAKVAVTGGDRLPTFALHLSAGGIEAVDQAGNRLTLSALADRAKVAMDQRLSKGEAARSHGEPSHDEGQAIDAAYEVVG